jgi:hypothetical protein
MKVLVIFTIDTKDYGEDEFELEINNLIKDIDPDSKLREFDMFPVADKFLLSDYVTFYKKLFLSGL